MKRIGIDARLLTQTGVGTYLQNLLYWLPKKLQDTVSFNVYVRSSDLVLAERLAKGMNIRISDHLWHSFAEQTAFLSQITHDHNDLFHFTYFSYPLLYKGNYVSTIHDVTPLMFKTGKASTMNPLWYEIKHRVFSTLLTQQLKRSLALMTPSQWVKDELERLFGKLCQDKITVTSEGLSYTFEDLETTKNLEEKSEMHLPYFLYVGNCYPHKNVERLVRAFMQRPVSDQHLVFAGPDDFFLRRIMHLVHQHDRIADRVHFIANPDVEKLKTLYSNSTALVHPSLSEGFGLTLIEAAHFGLPVIASNLPVVRELLGNSFIPFDPLSIASISDAIGTPVSQMKPAEYDAKKFSFSRMATLTADIYLKYV